METLFPEFPPSQPGGLMECRWHAMPEALGGWCVQAGPNPPSTGLDALVADFASEDVARHVAELHNAWLDGGRTLP